MRKSASPDGSEIKQTIVLKDSEVEGDIFLPGNLCLFGKIFGNVTAKGKVEVKTGAEVIGNISCGELEVEGLVEGNVETCFLVIEENAVLKGDVQAGKLLVRAVRYDIKRLRLVRNEVNDKSWEKKYNNK